MTNYPSGQDNFITLPGASGTSDEDIAINSLRNAVFAIEKELGITPSGIYPDVRTRLDILESRIQFSVDPQIPNDGYIKSPLFIWNTSQSTILTISDGYGAPTENRLDGSLYMRGGDGYANNQLYVRLNGQWFPVQTEQWQAAHDLIGFPVGTDGHLGQTVVGLYNHPFNTTMNSVGAVQDGYHVTWNNSLAEWEPQTGFIPGHDLAIFSGPYGRTGQTVIGIQGTHVSSVAPGDGYYLVYSGTDKQWEPHARAVVFDGYVSRVNLKSNRFQQSPIINTYTGIVNLGTSTDGSGGASGDYSIILGGDRNTASNNHSVVIGGLTNTASGQFATVINGTTNTASQTQAFVVDGYTNTASGINSFVLNGGNNIAAGNFTSVLNGLGNTIATGNIHAGIVFGSNNQISGSTATYSVIIGGSGNILNGTNSFIGNAQGAQINGIYDVIISGLSNTITSSSTYGFIGTGSQNLIGTLSNYCLIGTGSQNTIFGNNSAVLSGSGHIVGGSNSLILGGNGNNVSATMSTIVNGSGNTVNGTLSWATILDGYSNTVTSSGGVITGGYNNTVSGLFSTVLNGNGNTLASNNSTILNGSSNITDSASVMCTIVNGTSNSVTTTTNGFISGGNSNTLVNANNTFIFGATNSVQSTSSKIIGSGNTIGTDGTLNRVFGNNNTIGNTSTNNTLFGNGNQLLNSTSTDFVFGMNNIVDTGSNVRLIGSSNIVTSNFGSSSGQYGRARLFGQEVMANSRFTATTVASGSNGLSLPQATINVVSTAGFPASGTITVITSQGLQSVTYTGTSGGNQFTGCTGGTGAMTTGNQVGKVGEAQWSKLILTGTSTSGATIPLQLQDVSAVNPSFVDGYSYDMSVKVVIVNTSPISPNPVVPARYYIDILAHQENGVLVLDNVNYSLSTPNTPDSPSRTPWTVSVNASGNQLTLQVDAELTTAYVQPSNTPSNRRAIATIDMREISRI